MKTMKLAVAALSVVAFSTVACSKKKNSSEAQSTAQADAPVDIQLTDTFSKIDPQYDFNNRNLTDKIEGIEVEGPIFQKADFAPGLGHVKGSILVKGWETPVGFYSKAVTQEQLSKGEQVELDFHGDQDQWDSTLGAKPYGVVKCLDKDCDKVALFLSVYSNKAGYILQANEAGYSLSASIGPAVSIKDAQDRRNRSHRGDE